MGKFTEITESALSLLSNRHFSFFLLVAVVFGLIGGFIGMEIRFRTIEGYRFVGFMDHQGEMKGKDVRISFPVYLDKEELRKWRE